uniref:Protein 5 n=1 Tax=Chamaemelum virus 1 TaxID=2977963 RepID=A0A9N6YJ93_9RHAB|nr:TPA_asm: protein 5 [Chamaemelum virus 1]
MSWLTWIKRINDAIKVIAQITDTVTVLLNDPDVEHHTRASFGVAKKHILGLEKSLGIGGIYQEGDQPVNVLRRLHQAERDWYRKIVGHFVLHMDYKGGSKPGSIELHTLLLAAEKQFPHSSRLRGNHMYHSTLDIGIIDKLERMIGRLSSGPIPPSWCGNDCEHDRIQRCLETIAKKKRGTGHIDYARMLSAVSDDFSPQEIQRVNEIKMMALNLMLLVSSSPKSILRNNHPLFTCDPDNDALTLTGQVTLHSRGASYSYIKKILLMVKSVVTLVPHTIARTTPDYDSDMDTDSDESQAASPKAPRSSPEHILYPVLPNFRGEDRSEEVP